MSEKVLSKDQISNFAAELMKISKVLAPVKKEDYFAFEEISSGDQVALDYLNTKVPPKEIFYPRQEVLFKYKKTPEGIEIIEAENPIQEQIVLGIRSCDARSFSLLEKFFDLGKYQDPYFKRRKEKTTLIGLACVEPISTCFCTSVNGSPFDEEVLDAILIDLGDKYLVKALNDKGKQLISKVSLLKDASAQDVAKANEIREKAIASVNKVAASTAKEKLDKLFDEDAFWAQFSDKCIGCATCTFLCPTCSCFDVTDEDTAEGGARIRLWDTCQFPLFTKHGSGHNPRPTSYQRLRQRVMHKFSYYPSVLNEIGCVGCGRCVIMCPVNQDIRTVFKTLEGT